MSEAVIVEEVGVSFGDRRVLDGIDLLVDDGCMETIVGPSGCGKTTLLKILDGLLEPDSGRVKVCGETGFMFQEPRLLRWRTVAGNVRLGAELEGRRLEERVVNRLLDDVGLDGYADKYPERLSGGEKQRVALARTLAVDPDILLMDEPVSALDARTRRELQDMFLDIQRRFEKTVVFVTHSVEEAVKMGERIHVFSQKPTTVLGTIDAERDDAAEQVFTLLDPGQLE